MRRHVALGVFELEAAQFLERLVGHAALAGACPFKSRIMENDNLSVLRVARINLHEGERVLEGVRKRGETILRKAFHGPAAMRAEHG